MVLLFLSVGVSFYYFDKQVTTHNIRDIKYRVGNIYGWERSPWEGEILIIER